MTKLSLTAEQNAALKETLTSYLSDLRMEIADTDKQDFRELLKKKKELLNEILLMLD